MKWYLLLLLLVISILFFIEIGAYLIRKTTIYLEDRKLEKIMERKNNFIIEEVKEENGIPKNILQTYKDIKIVPDYVFDNLKNKNTDWKYNFFDDRECEKFIKKEYGDKILNRYLKLRKGAHKADIFRLCWLYKNGGIYVDIDTQLTINLDEMVKKINGDNLSIPITHDRLERMRLLNCIIITSKGNPLIKKCLENILKVDPDEINRPLYYHLYLITMQSSLEDNVNYHFKEINETSNNYYLTSNNEWIIIDNKNEMIGRSRYENYSQKKGFKN